MLAAYDTCEDSDLGIDKATPFSEPYIFITQVRNSLENLMHNHIE
jgi:hypothetical protein